MEKEQIGGNHLINQAVSKIVEESQRAVASLSGVSSLTEPKDVFYQAVGDVRGRGLFYPYVGSGQGKGALVKLVDGSVKLDLINGIGVHILGHNHPIVQEASLRATAYSDVVMQGNLQPNGEYCELGQKLLELVRRKSSLTHVWLTTSGSMANENALKSCRQYRSPGKYIIAMDHAFAGRTTMMAELTDNPAYKVGLPGYNEVVRVPFYNKNSATSAEDSLLVFQGHLDRLGPKNIAAFTFEPMQGEGGYNVAPREFFLPMLKLCKQHDIPVWWDEVQTFCRTGEFFAFETLDLGDYVDVCTIGKSLQGAATFYTKALNPKPGLISGTFAGASAALASGLAIINYLDTQRYMGPQGKVQKVHQKFIAGLKALNETTCKGLLRDAGGLGLMIAVTPLDGKKKTVIKLLHSLFVKGLICFGCGNEPFKLRFLLPATLQDFEIDQALGILEAGILEMS